MANPIFEQMQMQNPLAKLMQDAQQFRQTFSGNPQQEVQRLLRSGQMTQEQFNQYASIAQQVSSMMR